MRSSSRLILRSGQFLDSGLRLVPRVLERDLLVKVALKGQVRNLEQLTPGSSPPSAAACSPSSWRKGKTVVDSGGKPVM